MSNSKKSILISWFVSLLFAVYVVLLMTAPFEYFPYILAARFLPVIFIWAYDKFHGLAVNNFFSYLFIPQGMLVIAVHGFKNDLRTVFKR